MLSNLACVALLVNISSGLRSFVFLLTSLCRRSPGYQSTSYIDLCDLATRIIYALASLAPLLLN